MEHTFSLWESRACIGTVTAMTNDGPDIGLLILTADNLPVKYALYLADMDYAIQIDELMLSLILERDPVIQRLYGTYKLTTI